MTNEQHRETRTLKATILLKNLKVKSAIKLDGKNKAEIKPTKSRSQATKSKIKKYILLQNLNFKFNEKH